MTGQAGGPLQVGDEVLVRGRVTEAWAGGYTVEIDPGTAAAHGWGDQAIVTDRAHLQSEADVAAIADELIESTTRALRAQHAAAVVATLTRSTTTTTRRRRWFR